MISKVGMDSRTLLQRTLFLWWNQRDLLHTVARAVDRLCCRSATRTVAQLFALWACWQKRTKRSQEIAMTAKEHKNLQLKRSALEAWLSIMEMWDILGMVCGGQPLRLPQVDGSMPSKSDRLETTGVQEMRAQLDHQRDRIAELAELRLAVACMREAERVRVAQAEAAQRRAREDEEAAAAEAADVAALAAAAGDAGDAGEEEHEDEHEDEQRVSCVVLHFNVHMRRPLVSWSICLQVIG